MKCFNPAEETVELIKSDSRIDVQAAALTPSIVTTVLSNRHSELRNFEICHLHTQGTAHYSNTGLPGSILMAGKALRGTTLNY